MSNEKFVIEGGRPLSGTLTPSGSKNEALPALAATLLATEPVTLRNVPRIADIEVMIQVLRKLGIEVTEVDRHTFVFDPRNQHTSALDADLCRRIRASILFAGPLVAKTGQAQLPPPGGDVIGRRRLDTHFQALAALGANVTSW